MGHELSDKASSASYSRTGGLRCLARRSPFLLYVAQATLTHSTSGKDDSRNYIFRILHRTSAQSHKVRSSAHPPPVRDPTSCGAGSICANRKCSTATLETVGSEQAFLLRGFTLTGERDSNPLAHSNSGQCLWRSGSQCCRAPMYCNPYCNRASTGS